MVQADLRFVVLVVVRTRLLAVFTDTVGRVVLTAIHAARHILCHAVPLGQGQRTRTTCRTGPVPLRSTETGQTQLMVVVDTLGDVREIAVALKTGTLDVTVAPGAATHYRDCPAVFHQTGRNGEQHFVITVVPHRVTDTSAFLGVYTAGHDVDRTAHRRSRQLACTHTALRLHHTRHVAQTLPVGPIHGSAFHVVHRHTVDHRSYVRVVETTHPDL